MRALWALSLLAVMAACSDARTMLVVRVDSDLAVPGQLDSVRVVVSHAGHELQTVSVGLGAGGKTLPVQVGLLSPSGGGDVAIVASGWLGAGLVVGQEVDTTFVKGKSLAVDVFLAASCVGVDCPDATKTCARGEGCIDKARAPETLPVFVAGIAPVVDAGSRDGGPRRTPTDAADALVAPDVAGGQGGAGVDAGIDGRDGAAGAGGTGGAATDARVEVPPGCVPRMEDCFNGADDDCDGLPDCADPDCAPTTVCVPRPSGDVGTTVSAGQNCPSGFAKTASGVPFGSSLQGGGTSCAGCLCEQGPTACTASLTVYGSFADCQAGANGRPVTTVSSADNNGPCPVFDPTTTAVYGASLSAWTIPSTACLATGTAIKPTASFASRSSFCPAATINETGRTGCPAGAVCMRRAPAGAGGSCVLLGDAGACPAGTKPSAILYSGIQDARTCGACTCALEGASCDPLALQMGDGFACTVDVADLRGGSRACVASAVHAPGYHLAGTQANGKCTPSSALAGTLTAMGGRALCCLP
jgi:hypothetical protein